MTAKTLHDYINRAHRCENQSTSYPTRNFLARLRAIASDPDGITVQQAFSYGFDAGRIAMARELLDSCDADPFNINHDINRDHRDTI